MTVASTLLVRTQVNLSQLPGAGTQVFAEDVLLEKMHLAFDTLHSKYWWKQYMTWLSGDLDGTLGVITNNLALLSKRLVSYDDIQAIYPDGSLKNPLPEVPDNIPPSSITGGVGKFIEFYDDPAKLFRIVPYSATGIIHVRYRWKPLGWDKDTNILLDDTLMIRATAYQYMADDGTNPDATSTAQSALDEILTQKVGNQAKGFMANERRQLAAYGLDQWMG